MNNGPVFQAKTTDQFLGNLKLLAGTTDKMEGTKEVMSSVMRGINTALTAVGIESPKLKSLGGAPNVDPLGETCYSVTPFRYGDYIAKFAVFPVSADLKPRTKETIEVGDNPDAIRQHVESEMKVIDGEWELRVQLCRNLKKSRSRIPR